MKSRYGTWALLCAACVALFAGSASARSLSLDFNGYSFNLAGSMPLNRLFATDGPGAVVGAGFLYDSQNAGDHLKFVHADLAVGGDFGVPGATGEVGVRAFYGDRAHADGAGAALGGEFKYYWPRYNRVGVDANLWYSPNVLTGGDFQHYLQYGANLNYRVLRQATVFVGYRRVLLPVQGSLANVLAHAPDQGWHIGLRVDF